MASNTSYEVTKRYQDKKYDNVLLKIPKGDKEVWKTAAENLSLSLTSFVRDAVDEKIEQIDAQKKMEV